MWIITGILLFGNWVLHVSRGRTFARLIDRTEVAFLKPLGTSYLIVVIAFAISGAWLLAGVSALACLFNGAIGAGLHPGKGFKQLARGTHLEMEKGPMRDTTWDESHRAAKASMSAAAVLACLLFAVLLASGLRWYLAVLVALFIACLVMGVGIFLAAYHPKHDGNGKTPA
jgi:hypothetical protein